MKIRLDTLVSEKMRREGVLNKEAAALSDYLREIGRQYFIKSAEYKIILDGIDALAKLTQERSAV